MLRALGNLAARELGIAQAAPFAPRMASAYEPNLAPRESPAPREAGTEPAAGARVDLQAALSGETPVVVADPQRHREMRIDFASRDDADRVAPPRVAQRTPTAASVAAVSKPPATSPSTTAPPRVEWRATATSPMPSGSVASSAPGHGDLPASVPLQPAPAVDRLAPATHAPLKRQAGEPERTIAPLRPLPPPPLPARAATPNTTPAPVHVTIGRIEIRAAKDHAPAPVSSSSGGPAPSLAAYLRRRSDGGRS